ncbi:MULTISPECIES: hypothetical protein [Agrobacterium tumefaciens complex]|uniref:Uncharacterized protein n=1 Tax=Agrobacterium tomkonis CFBP 6623 TaxID=1183432 RepID=A0A1S7QBB5_9HYPH|nr:MULTISPECIES: hypothetical protein [Agrobacterium tumefaciens complex]QCL87818.1 hypothetical protein CFBP6623_00860 [Agrobacterium tumefaciens]CUX34237.1 conserved hypothetical protein [Agrobacterium tomkonis CFBP 6623]
MNHRHADFQAAPVEPKTAPYEEISVKPAIESQALSGHLSNALDTVQARVKEAALWLSLNPMTLHPVVTIRRRFALTVMEAAEAAKLAHSLSKPGASE